MELESFSYFVDIFIELGQANLADDVLHLLSVEDVRRVDDAGVARPVHLRRVLVLGLRIREHRTKNSTFRPAWLEL